MIIITALGNYYIDNQAINETLDSSLVETGSLIKTIMHTPDLAIPAKLQAIQSQLNAHPSLKKALIEEDKFKLDEIIKENNRYKFQLWDSDGKLLLNSPQAPTIPLIGKPGLSNKIIAGNKWRTFTIYDHQQGLILAIGEKHTSRYTLIRHMLIDDAYLTLLVYPLSGLFIWLIIGSSLKSIRFFAKELAERAADHLEPVNLNEIPIEISPLADELNKLFSRLQQAFEREQRFAADAAHELHTPLAALKTQAQLALKAADPQECYTHLKQVIAGVDRCTHVIQQLLTLCRLSPETIMPEHFTQINLARIAAEAVAQLAPQAILKQIEIELVATDSEYKLLGNATGLHVLIRNLVDNAIRYTPHGGMVKVVILNLPHAIHLHVIDNGPGIPEKLRSRVFERFFRVLGNNAQGSGLGLAIVEQIAKLHHGSIHLDQPATETGLKVEVRFPRDKN
ncbi:sensory histidine kinase in two-component regulatory system with QseB [Candidatus Rickettsiella viridis]|uniref:histidine kinase n=2 Tax=Candidatus Rickettsiella viridis TaxID=676208 RepID=A0A2Z5UVB7_9COXI|nr:sensory histidine kinase in two-component regulatory system with QseB [Candidatus Rickettsiella viridis]